ncbi:glutamate racemase [Chitinimonas sp. PSY-7]|uniref:glutamate racemase n=1 Tax=Chitinimonas sp. PSY-7 TaxID=3459088 RepID=UPI00403FF2A4
MPPQQASRPIGVFDSGIGGLTVTRALMERLPFEDIVYFGDTARVPYGVKSVATIEQFTQQIVDFLMQQEVKVLVIACNTISAVAANKIRGRVGIPVIDVIEAGAHDAVSVTQNDAIGVIATPTTVNSNAYARGVHALNADARVYSQACPLLVPLVEEGWLDHPVTRLTVQEYLKPVLAEGIDTLVLGCTHYPLLKPLLAQEVGQQVRLVDSAVSVAEQVASTLVELDLANPQRTEPVYRYYVTDIPLRFQTMGERFLGRSLKHLEMVQL